MLTTATPLAHLAIGLDQNSELRSQISQLMTSMGRQSPNSVGGSGDNGEVHSEQALQGSDNTSPEDTDTDA